YCVGDAPQRQGLDLRPAFFRFIENVRLEPENFIRRGAQTGLTTRRNNVTRVINFVDCSDLSLDFISNFLCVQSRRVVVVDWVSICEEISVQTQRSVQITRGWILAVEAAGVLPTELLPFFRLE